MSSAFVKEDEEQWLQDIQPTIGALINYLTNENNGIRVYEKSVSTHPETGKPLYKMSNGLSYAVDNNNRWYIVDL
jgi:hypothetical protein